LAAAVFLVNKLIISPYRGAVTLIKKSDRTKHARWKYPGPCLARSRDQQENVDIKGVWRAHFEPIRHFPLSPSIPLFENNPLNNTFGA
jgi:hypothetical protein